MAITVKHTKVSTIPDDADTSLVRPSDWNADHTLVGLGTMAEQNANAVAITGGTIDNTSIGATTPSTVNATTITGQTARLNGTGSNLVANSQGIGGTNWSNSGIATSTQNSAIAPDLTSTASTLTNATDVTFGGNNIRSQSTNITGGATYTASCYVKLGTATTCSIAIRDNSTGSVVTSTTTTAGSWVRLTATITYGSSTTSTFLLLGNANGTFFAWGAQLEFGSTANTYIPTTTTAIYGTPTLSFSGASSIGLLSNGALYLQPAGIGALQAQATTSTATGGNARGSNAVDWQTNRNAAGQVASGQYATIGGGYRGTASGFATTLGGGESNSNSGYVGTISGGSVNTLVGSYAVIAGGYSNTNSRDWSFLGAGYANTAGGFHNFIGAGFTNSGTANAAVTTQATTAVTSGSTAVTLSGSNANIRVGQLITGTGINSFPNTYVSAISGTSLTLSQNATATGTPTLSFFTPHGVVVGGGNNQATGSYSFIGGGGDAGTAANRNVASGDWSVVVGGRGNQATGLGAFIGGGGFDGATLSANTVGGLSATVAGGMGNNASGYNAVISGGRQNQANSTVGTINGGGYGTSRGITGYTVSPASFSPLGTFLVGSSQSALLVLGKQTTDATATALTSDGATASGVNQVILPNNSAYFFTGEVISGVTGGGNTKGWTIEGVIKRGANAASTALVGVPTVTSTYADLGAATWDIAVTADTTNGGLRVTFTGQAATTIRTVCQIRTTEMTY